MRGVGPIRDTNAQLASTRDYAGLVASIAKNRENTPERRDATHNGNGVEYTSWGQQFVESEQFRSYTGRGQSGVIELGGFRELEMRAVIPSTSLAIPHFIYAPVEAQATQTPLLDVCGRVSVSSGTWTGWRSVLPRRRRRRRGRRSRRRRSRLPPDRLTRWRTAQITRQALEDAAYIQSLLESKLRRGLGAKAEADMATAIDASTTVQTATTSLAAQGSLLKSIRVGIGKVEAAGYNPNAVALNPTDYASLDIDVMGTTDYGPVRAATFWGLRPVAAASIPAGKAYVGDFQTGATLFDRGVTNVFLTDSHASLFISNILVILAEARVKSVVTEGPAICECSTVA